LFPLALRRSCLGAVDRDERGAAGVSNFAQTRTAKERKYRVDDAIHATRAAVEGGILPGGGVALLRASEVLMKVGTQNDGQRIDADIVRKASLGQRAGL
jgi:chaperonin GroEL (HSP60 family)